MKSQQSDALEIAKKEYNNEENFHFLLQILQNIK